MFFFFLVLVFFVFFGFGFFGFCGFVVLFFGFFVYSTPTLKQQINPSPLERVDMHVGRDVAYLIQSKSAKTQVPGSPLEPDFCMGHLGRLWRCQDRITSLDFRRRHLQGQVPPEIGQLHHLTHLQLHDNQLTGEIPAELGQLQKLKMLQLSSNKLTGETPQELGQLQNLRWLYLGQNQLTGEIPSGTGQLLKLQRLDFAQNRLSGEVPQELGQLKSLRVLFLGKNQLTGQVPRELGHLRNLENIDLSQNQLTGQIPSELGQFPFLWALDLSRNLLSGRIIRNLDLPNLEYLDLSHNQLSGDIPGELGQLLNLQWLYLSGNKLTGQIPRELGQLQRLKALLLSQNHLTGEIPEDLGELPHLGRLYLAQNQLSGRIPQKVCQLRRLTELLLQQNRLRHFPTVLQMPYLRVLDVSSNAFRGRFRPRLSVGNLQCLDLSHNKFAEGISGIVEFFCARSPVGGVLQELRLNHNLFSGEVPSCLLQFAHLTFLALNNNRFRGSLPEITAPRLTILSLHKNSLTGVLPEGLYRLSRLGVLTLHDNSIGGKIGSLNVSAACLNNAKFRLRGLYDCSSLNFLRDDWQGEELAEVESNCPASFRTCSGSGLAKLTLHHNRFSCAVPEFISSSKVLSLVVMGNMLGDGTALASSWISKEERHPFLYYSPSVFKSNMLVLAGFLLLMLCAGFCGHRLKGRLAEVSRRSDFDARARVASSGMAL